MQKDELISKGAKMFSDDLSFLSRYMEVIVLEDTIDGGRVAISPALQGRVMTSTTGGESSMSYGWINRDLFESGDTLEQINVFGGEERFWLGPEGGQFSLFFEGGDPFDLEHWQTPRLIDLEPFDLVSQDLYKASFSKDARITNYSGFEFSLKIRREISILTGAQIEDALGIDLPASLNQVAYRTVNILTNQGETPWEKETGLLSIWLLGMFNHSPGTVVIAPYLSGAESELGPIVNDTYFGKVPPDRLFLTEKAILFKGDGQYRSKIGLSPLRATDVLGSYDLSNNSLTMVKYDKPEGITDYVNSMWELQEKPYAGDVINSYNDGPPAEGEKPLGPFYELETSSYAAALFSGESLIHTQNTFHFEGDERALSALMERILGVSTNEIRQYINVE